MMRGLTGAPATPRSSTAPPLPASTTISFGLVGRPGNQSLSFEVFNVGTADLVIASVVLKNPPAPYHLIPAPATPVTVAPGANISVTVNFAPGINDPGDFITTVQINSNDPGRPVVFVSVSGTGSHNFFKGKDKDKDKEHTKEIHDKTHENKLEEGGPPDFGTSSTLSGGNPQEKFLSPSRRAFIQAQERPPVCEMQMDDGAEPAQPGR